MSWQKRLWLLGLMSLFFCNFLFANEVQKSWKTYDISWFFKNLSDSDPQTIWGSHVLDEEEEEDSAVLFPFFQRREAVPLLRPNELIGLLNSSIGRTNTDPEEIFDVQGGKLFVFGKSTTHKRVEEMLGDFEQSLRPFEIHLFAEAVQAPLGTLPEKLKLSSAELATLRKEKGKSLKTLWQTQGSIFSGYTFIASQREQWDLVPGYEVDVATKAKGVRPKLARAIGGPSVAIRPYWKPGSNQIYLTASLDLTELLEKKAFATKSPDFGEIQIPQIQLRNACASTTLLAGESWLIQTQDSQNSYAWIIRAENDTSNPGNRKMMPAVDTRYFQDRSGKLLPQLEWTLKNADGADFFTLSEEGLIPDFLNVLFRSVSVNKENPDQRPEQILPTYQRVLGAIYFLSSAPESSPTLRDSLLSLQELYPPSFSIKMEIRPAENTGTASQTWKALTSAHWNRCIGFLVGKESYYISGYETQIAQESVIAAPRVETLFSGLILRAKPVSYSADGIRLEYDLKNQALLSLELLPSTLSQSGDFQQVKTSRTMLKGNVDLNWDKSTWLGDLGVLNSQNPEQKYAIYLTLLQDRK